ncbi:hypothetical protein F4553_000740 [Allocatelliglobosispora scoriae]|uniref:Peptidase M15B domain-containing protein n=1 Tax=Allocatelliglobosispora scoriae TaxID=643052 RepID=A0A841BKF5_9ACTN|nr:D-alanyl-D-alanine carboxypeptidase family protein [Allocatelliglobosispora scoriae]MBB5867361.1 hypothetical protein [Allocatelliglobosispora scoriae]
MKLTDAQIAHHAYAAGFRGDHLVTAVAVALAESGGRTDRPGDTGITNGTWGPSIGLWQIRSLHAQRGTGGQRDQLANADPAVNARHAYQISHHGQSWSPWSAFTNGSYRQYLDRARTAARSAGSGGTQPAGGGAPSGGSGKKPGSGKGGGRIVLDLAELRRLETLMETSHQRVRHSIAAVRDTASGLALASSALPQAGYLTGLFDALSGPFGLDLVARHLDWETRLVERTRRLAAAALGDDHRVGPEDAGNLLRLLGGRHGLPETAVLQALLAGGLRAGHRAAPTGRAEQPKVPAHPPKLPMNQGDIVPASLRRFSNGHLPAGKLVAVGEGERLAETAATRFRRMDAAARADGVNLRVVSGYRTYAEQQRLYDLYRAGRGNLAAAPGTSNHGWGLAADLDVAGQPGASTWLRANAARYGFFNDVAGEPWHWTYRPGGKA